MLVDRLRDEGCLKQIKDVINSRQSIRCVGAADSAASVLTKIQALIEEWSRARKVD